MAYICPRCDYSTSVKYNFIKHINIKNTCPPTKSESSLDDIRSLYILKKRELICVKCSKVFKHDSSFGRHKKICEVSTKLPHLNQETIPAIFEMLKEIQLDLKKMQATNLVPSNNITQNINNNITIGKYQAY